MKAKDNNVSIALGRLLIKMEKTNVKGKARVRKTLKTILLEEK